MAALEGRSTKVSRSQRRILDDNAKLAERFFRRRLGPEWRESGFDRVSGWGVIEILHPLDDVFRERLGKIEAQPYDALLEPAADGVVDDLAATLETKVISMAPLAVQRVLLERHLQLGTVALTNLIVGNFVTRLPPRLSAVERLAAVALLLMREMKLVQPPRPPA